MNIAVRSSRFLSSCRSRRNIASAVSSRAPSHSNPHPLSSQSQLLALESSQNLITNSRCHFSTYKQLHQCNIPKNSSSRLLSSSASSILESYSLESVECNIPQSIVDKIGKNLHLQPKHPLHIIKANIETYWKQMDPSFLHVDNLKPIVSTYSNFDSLRIGSDHVSRSKSDTYYLTNDTVLRTHTSAHQNDLLTQGHNCFLVSGDVYRRDEIDASHYPVFHQMEGVKVFPNEELIQAGAISEEDRMKYVEEHLKTSLEGMVRQLFGDVEMRWGEDYFPFTHPSFELEIFYENDWLEVLGCGVIHPEILSLANRPPSDIGWAFGLGLERLAMVLFSIPDIRLFWTEDLRFHSQFESGDIVTFEPYSKYPPCFKDVSFWIPDIDAFHSNDLMEIVRDIAGDIVEKVFLVDEFVHPKTGKTSHCYRISYRHMDRSLTNEEVDALQMEVREKLVEKMGVELR